MKEDRLTGKKSLLAALGLLVAALALVAAGCGGGRRWGARGDGAAVVLVHGARVRGRGRSRSAHRLGPAAAGRRRACRRCRCRRDPLRCSTRTSGRPATTTSPTSRATTRRRRPAQLGLGQVLGERNAYAANDALIGVIGTFNSGCAAIIIPVLNAGADGGIAMCVAGEHVGCLTVNLPVRARRRSRTSTTRPAPATTCAWSPRTTTRARPWPSS